MNFFLNTLTYGQSNGEMGLYISLVIMYILLVIVVLYLFGVIRALKSVNVMFAVSIVCVIIFSLKVTHDNCENIQNAITAEYSDAEFSELEIREGTFTSEGEQYKYEVKDDTIIICQVSSGDEVKIIN